jgi:hypothetical protein
MNAPTQLYRRKHSSRHTKKNSIFDVMATRHVQISQVLAGIEKEPQSFAGDVRRGNI